MVVKYDENEQSMILVNQHANLVEYLFRRASY